MYFYALFFIFGLTYKRTIFHARIEVIYSAVSTNLAYILCFSQKVTKLEFDISYCSARTCNTYPLLQYINYDTLHLKDHFLQCFVLDRDATRAV